MAKFAVILPAAGKSTRFSDKEKKPFASIDGRPVWLRTAEVFVNRPDVVQTLLIIAPEDQELFERRYRANVVFMNIKLVFGGKERFDSVANALDKLLADVEFVAIHDAVRPCLTADLVEAVFGAAQKEGAAMLAVPVQDTLKRADVAGCVQATESRDGLWLAQTPQVFRKDWIIEAYAKRQQAPQPITDDAQLVEALGHKVWLIPSASTNIKITTKQDLLLAQAILKSRPEPKVKGPIHPFAEEEQMWK